MMTFRTVRTVLLACLMLLLFSEHSMAQSGTNRKTRINIDRGGKSTYQWQNGGYSLKVEFDGDVEWMDDDSGIKSMSRGSYLEIEEKTRNERHYLQVEARSGNELEYSYRRNGKRQPFDDEAQAWFANVLPAFIRESGIGAESRTKRILAASGVDGVLEEADLISSPSVKALYLLFMFDHAELTGPEAARAARVSSGISSPGDRTRFLKATAKAFFMHDEAIQPFFDTARSISSPGDKTRLLIHLVEEDLLADVKSYTLALETAKTISSPGDKARFMKAAVSFFVPEAMDEYFEVANTISSPGDHARVLNSLLDHEELDNESLDLLLQSARKISSPGDKARVLINAADQMDESGTSEDVIEVYLEVAKSISSPGDRSRVLIHVIDAVEMSESSMLSWFETVKSVSSPGDKARVLIRSADMIEDNDELVEAYIEAAETVSSPGDRRRVLEALLD